MTVQAADTDPPRRKAMEGAIGALKSSYTRRRETLIQKYHPRNQGRTSNTKLKSTRVKVEHTKRRNTEITRVENTEVREENTEAKEEITVATTDSMVIVMAVKREIIAIDTVVKRSSTEMIDKKTNLVMTKKPRKVKSNKKSLITRKESTKAEAREETMAIEGTEETGRTEATEMRSRKKRKSKVSPWKSTRLNKLKRRRTCRRLRADSMRTSPPRMYKRSKAPRRRSK